MRIYFGDIVHTWEKASVWTVPINVGFVAAYTKKHFPDAEISIFRIQTNCWRQRGKRGPMSSPCPPTPGTKT